MDGVDIDWLAFHTPYERNLELLTLPAYAWDMKDYWVPWTERGSEAVREKSQAASSDPYVATCAQYLVQKSSSPKIQVTFRASLSDPGFLALIDGNKMQQIGLASGSVFCDAAVTAAKYAIEYGGRKGVNATSLTLHDPELLAPLTKSLVGVDGELVTTAVMESPSSDTVSVSFKATSVRTSHNLGSFESRLATLIRLRPTGTGYHTSSKPRWRRGLKMPRRGRATECNRKSSTRCSLMRSSLTLLSRAFKKGISPTTSRRLQQWLFCRTTLPLAGLHFHRTGARLLCTWLASW